MSQNVTHQKSFGYFFDDYDQNGTQRHVMISYSWANKREVNEIVQTLQPFVHIWRDKSNLHGTKDIWSSIANAIDKAEFVVAILTPDYEKSDSATNELNYALNINKTVVPIYIDANFRPTGNVGLRTSKLYFYLYQDLLNEPFLFVKHLFAMSVKSNNIEKSKIHLYQVPCLKYKIAELEVLMKKNSTDKQSERAEKRIQKEKMPDNSNYNNYKNNDYNNNDVYNCRNEKKEINTNMLHVPNDNLAMSMSDSVSRKMDTLSINALSNQHHMSSSSSYSSSGTHHTYSIEKSSIASNGNGFDFHTSEQDEPFSIVSKGAQAQIRHYQYKDRDDLIHIQYPNSNEFSYELLIDLRLDAICCFLHLRDDLVLVATEKAQFNLLKSVKSKWNFVRTNITVKFKDKEDLLLYKEKVKQIVDMCLDSNGNLIVLSEINANLSQAYNDIDSKCLSYHYSIDLFEFDASLGSGINYLKRVLFVGDENVSYSQKPSLINTDNTAYSTSSTSSTSPLGCQRDNSLVMYPKFTRVYNDDSNRCVILLDSLNDRIYWFKKSTGLKMRCLKSVNNSLREPSAISLIEKKTVSGSELILVCSRTDLLITDRSYTLKHEIKNAKKKLNDICFDSKEQCFYLIDSNCVYVGRLIQQETNNSNNKIPNKSVCINDIKETNLKYKQLYRFENDEVIEFKRIISTPSYLFILFESTNTQHKMTIYAIDKSRD